MYYTSDLTNIDPQATSTSDPNPATNLPTWFDDVNAPQKILRFLFSEAFPLSPASRRRAAAIHEDRNTDRDSGDGVSVLDVGTGNGAMLFQLRAGLTRASPSSSDEGEDASSDISPPPETGYAGPLYGIDYSPPSIALARSLNACRAGEGEGANIHFHVMDVVRERPADMPWWPRQAATGDETETEAARPFDLVLDKGTFDAVSLSSEMLGDGSARRQCEVYPQLVSRMVRVGGYLLVTSCNWTEGEVVRWFCAPAPAPLHGGGGEGALLEVFHRIQYPTFTFGGKSGAGVASVCFRRVK